MKYHLVELSIVEVTSHSGQCCPNKDVGLQQKGYKIEFSIRSDEQKIEQSKIKKGRFILASNELDKDKLPKGEILKEYKVQAGTERGFKFIKGGSFPWDFVFLRECSSNCVKDIMASKFC